MTTTDTIVELEGVNGEWFNLTTGDRGVYLATNPTGCFYDPPVKVVYEEPGNYPGARYLNHRILRRDIVFGVQILHDKGANSWLSRDSEWRKAWAFDQDCVLHVTTPDSGTRKLKIRLGESPDVEMVTDPRGNTINLTKMVCISGDPFWYEDDAIYTAVTQTDTTFDPNALHLPWPWPQEELPSETLTIVVDPEDGKGGLNPTDQPIFLKWILPGSAAAPAAPYIPGLPWLGAPNSEATTWTVPDYSFDDPAKANRRLKMPSLIGGLRVEEVQAIYIDGRPTSGTFTLTFDGQTTTPIAYNASTGVVEAALVALSNVVLNDVDVQQATATNEVQNLVLSGGITGGTFTLTFDGQTTAPIPFNASSLDIQLALGGLNNLGFFDIGVTAPNIVEVQKVEIIGEPTSGTFTLTFDGQTTAPISFNATAIEVYLALTGLSNIDLLDISVDRNQFVPYSPWEITFAGPLGTGDLLGQGVYQGVDVPLMTANASSLAGGAGMDVQITEKVKGSRPFTISFGGAVAGINLPQMTANASGLTGSGSHTVTIETSVDGSRPYLVTFTGLKSGVDVPQMTINTASLAGGSGVTGKVKTLTEGYTYPGEDAVIDTDPRVEQVVSASGSQLWSRMNGVRFRYPVPAYTRDKTFELTVSGAEIGQMATLRIPRPWTRPWGLE